MPQTLFLDTGSIEWDIAVPDSSLDELPPVGEHARIYVWMYHREDAMRLFGFASPDDRSVFIDLMKVEGVGAKAAVRIMSNIGTKDLVSALESEDTARLEKIPGIGRKTAQKMMLALKGKLELSDGDNGTSGNRRLAGEQISPWNDVIVALVNMGYDRKNIEEVIQCIEKEIDSSLPRSTREEQLFRRALVELAL
jgi:Holliday junction DNA helicase RuvA